MRRIIELNDSGDVSEERIAELADRFVHEPFDFSATLDDDDCLIVEVTKLGIVVSTIDWVVADLTLADEIVEVMLGGQTVSWYRRCLVDDAVAAPAVIRFLRDLEMPGELGWIPTATLAEWERAHQSPLLDDDAVIELWNSGDRFGAVREYRRTHQLGLKEALDALRALTGTSDLSHCSSRCGVTPYPPASTP